MTQPSALFWFRRDLRTEDNRGLYEALAKHNQVYCAFILDSSILDPLPRQDRRVDFIMASLQSLQLELRQHGGELLVRHGLPIEEIPLLARNLGVDCVYANKDYEPAAILRDRRVSELLEAEGRRLSLYKDHVVFEEDEILTAASRPYTVFTPYKNNWQKKVRHQDLEVAGSASMLHKLAQHPATDLPALQDFGFESSDLSSLPIAPGSTGARVLLDDFSDRIEHYKTLRDFPSVKGVSYLSAHLRFGTISIRRLARLAYERQNAGADCWLGELIWRDFYQQFLWHFPNVAKQSFKPEYQNLAYENNEEWFAAWKEGRTGYPIVDAAMRQLLHSGYMHNRLRMIVASFLVKDLLIDWRWGEAWFAEKLLDFDLAANNGGWQWSASTGCDAQPYFRIFNPVSQSEKFDPQGKFIRRYVPELATFDDKAIHAPWQAKTTPPGFRLGLDYPHPIVDHAVQREKALALFGKPA